jgi:hypothetical protein
MQAEGHHRVFISRVKKKQKVSVQAIANSFSRLTFFRARRSSVTSFQRPSLGFGEQQVSLHGHLDAPSNGSQEHPYRQEPPRVNNESFAALENLSALASARAQSSTPAQLPSLVQHGTPLNISPATSAALFKIYFSIIHPMWPILYKPMHDLTGLEYLPHKLPLPLLYAIYSIAACVQPHSELAEEKLQDVPSPQQTSEAALHSLFQHGLLHPSIETCQALTILALQQHGISESAPAALLMSLASSMAIELRLHRAMSSGADSTEVQIRSRLWWTIFVLDKMIACEMGRPVLLRWEEQDTPLPSSLESDEYQLLALRTAGEIRTSKVKTYTISGFHTTIYLTQIMEKISREIYSISGRRAIGEDSQTAVDIRETLEEQLKDYHNMLDASPLALSNTTVAAPVSITNYVVSSSNPLCYPPTNESSGCGVP